MYLKNPNKIKAKQEAYDKLKIHMQEYADKGHDINPGKIEAICPECGYAIIWDGGKKMSRNGPYTYRCLCSSHWADDKGAGIIQSSRG